jgi:hypothetical protein
MHRLACQNGNSLGQLGAGPQTPVRGSAQQLALKLLLLRRRQAGGAALTAGITFDGARSLRVVALDQLADAVGGASDHGRGLGGRVRRLRLAEQPQGLPTHLLPAIPAVSETLAQFVRRQMRHEFQSRHLSSPQKRFSGLESKNS